jgi:AcrR family transcriptional regulator
MAEGAATPIERPREAIIRVATRLFGQQSYPATTMRDIAREVGILAGSLYAHIDGKESMLLEITESGVNEFLDRVGRAAAAEKQPDARMRAMIHAHVEVVAANPQKTLIVFHQWRYLTEPNQTVVRDLRRKYENLFTKAVKDGVAAGTFSADLDQRIAVLTILGTLNWTPEWLSPDGPESIVKIGDKLADALLSGLLARSAARRRKT